MRLRMMISALQSFFSSLTAIQIQKYTAVTATIIVFINISKLIYDFNKDRTKVAISIKRDDISLLAKQNPLVNYLCLEVVNKSATPVTINEVGIVTKSKQYLNFVDMPWAFMILKNDDDAMGSIEWSAIPGTVNPGGLGIVQFNFSNLKESYNINKEQETSPEIPGYLGILKVLNAYDDFIKFYDEKTQTLKLKPYVVTSTGKRFVGKKTIIKLGNLHETLIPNGTKNYKSREVRNHLGIKVWTKH